MSLHTARKKVDELTYEELDKELNSAKRLFVDLDWRYEYNRRMKLFKDEHPDATETELKFQHSKEAHHLAVLLNAVGNDYIDLLKAYIDLKKQCGLYTEFKTTEYSVFYKGVSEDGKAFMGRKYYNTKQEALDAMNSLIDDKMIDIINVSDLDNQTIKTFTRED